MKIDFTADRVGKTKIGIDAPVRWSLILGRLKAESGCALYDDSFDQWALKEWSIKFLHDNKMYPTHLTGVELSEETLTMLLLKYPMK